MELGNSVNPDLPASIHGLQQDFRVHSAIQWREAGEELHDSHNMIVGALLLFAQLDSVGQKDHMSAL